MNNIFITTFFLFVWLLAPANRYGLNSELSGGHFSEMPNVVNESLSKFDFNNQNLPSKDLLLLSLNGFFQLLDSGVIHRNDLVTIIDFRLPSTEKRLWVLDLEKGKTLFHTLVAHGKNTGELYAKKFSNISGSYTSSLGFYTTGNTYQGGHGLSLYLDGVEPGINDNARDRAIVIHGADYATESFIKENGRLGRSFGCPSLPPEINEDVIQTIAGGSCLFIYADDMEYLSKSGFINSL